MKVDRQTQRPPDAAIRQRAVCADHLPQGHVGGAERQRRAVPVARLIEPDAELPKLLDERLGAQQLQHAHGRHVE